MATTPHNAPLAAALPLSPAPEPRPTRLLLVAPEAVAARIGSQLYEDLDAEITSVAMQRAAEDLLAAQVFDLLLVEESLLLAQPQLVESLWRRSGDTPLLEVNFGITSPVRVVSHVRAALRRRTADLDRAQAVALHTLRGELTASLTGLLLETELALRVAGPELTPALRSVLAIVEAIARQLRV